MMNLTLTKNYEEEIELLKDQPFFKSVKKEDLDRLKKQVEKVYTSGIACAALLTRHNSRNTHYKADLMPDFDSHGQTSHINISFEAIPRTSFEKLLSYIKLSDTTPEITNFSALATFDRQLTLKDYFTSSTIDFFEIFSSPKARGILNKWLKEQFNNSGNSILDISIKDTAYFGLNLTFMGLNKKTDRICIRIEFIDENSEINSLHQISDLKRSILNTIPADIAIWDLNYRYIFLNKSAIKDDMKRDWIIGKDDFEYCKYWDKPIDIALERRKSHNKMILTGEQVHLEEQLETKEGTKHLLRIFKPILDSNGQVKFGLGYGVDITSVKQIETNLDKMSLAVKSTMDGVAILDEKGHYIYINEAYVKMFGYQSEKDFIGKSWHMLYEKKEIEILESKIFPIIMANGRWVGDTKGKLKDGTPIYQEITLTSLPDGGLICICRDKTEQRNQKRRLERAAIVADNTSSVIAISDKHDRIQWINKAFTDVLGYTMDEVLGRDPTFLHGPETDKRVIKKILKRPMDPKGFSGEILNYSKNGTKYWMQINATPIYNEEGELINFVAVANDITALKYAEENIKNNLQKEKELNELKSQFVSIASHEIRTPLASIQSSADLIKMFLDKDLVPKDKIEKHLEKIESQITRLSTIMSNLLTVGRINLGKFDLHKNETDVENFVRNIIAEFFSVTSDGRKIKLEVIGKKQKSQIDKVLMSQVLINLISNAIKYSVGKSDPEVIVTYFPNYYTIKVKDPGIGIPEEQHKNIFNSFFRANNVENIQGTGLGLVIVKKFVEMHKGKISFTSTLGKGTTFEVKFPYQ